MQVNLNAAIKYIAQKNQIELNYDGILTHQDTLVPRPAAKWWIRVPQASFEQLVRGFCPECRKQLGAEP